MVGTLNGIGDAVIRFVVYVNTVATIIGYCLWRMTFGLGQVKRVVREGTLRQILFTGVDALGFVGWTALLTAIIIVLQSQLVIKFGQLDTLGSVLVLTLVREVGPLLAGLIVLSRSGTAIAVELGNMKSAGEIDTMETMGIDPFEYLVVPRVIGSTLALFSVTVWFVFISLVGGFAFGMLFTRGSPTATEFLELITRDLTSLDLPLFLAKTLVSGMLIATINCIEGFAVGESITEVPRATTRGVVRSLGAVLLWNVLMTVLFYLLV